VSEYNTILEAPSFPPPTVISLKGRLPIRLSSPKKRTVAKYKDLALLSPIIKFRAFREAEN